VGSNAGSALLTVNSAPNNISDSYLLLGDSITSNCWEVATNAYPTEQLGTQINAAKSTRFPIVTEAGIPGLTAASPLATTPYSKPVIQQWLSDFPAVKFVGLSYGTNDANQGVSAATYCSNMRTMVQYVIAAGKTPIIPTIAASPSSAVQSNAPAMNACLATLKQNYPAIISGPDLWTLFSGHSTSDGRFLDTLHPSLGTGCTALQNAWTNAMISAEYPQQ
jgi:lysophospholipase L1-like esterase